MASPFCFFLKLPSITLPACWLRYWQCQTCFTLSYLQMASVSIYNVFPSYASFLSRISQRTFISGTQKALFPEQPCCDIPLQWFVVWNNKWRTIIYLDSAPKDELAFGKFNYFLSFNEKICLWFYIFIVLYIIYFSELHLAFLWFFA